MNVLVYKLVQAIDRQSEKHQLDDFVLDFEKAVAELVEFVGAFIRL